MKANNTGSCSFAGIARCLIILPFCLFLLRVSPVENREFTLGFLVPYNVCKRIGNSYHCGKMYASAITVALDKINSDPHLLSGHNMTYIWSDTRCDQTTAVKQQLRQLREGVDAFIGPGCDCDTAAVVAEATDKPMISYVSKSFFIMILNRIVVVCFTVNASLLMMPPEKELVKTGKNMNQFEDIIFQILFLFL